MCGMIYLNVAWPSERYPTIEVRIAGFACSPTTRCLPALVRAPVDTEAQRAR